MDAAQSSTPTTYGFLTVRQHETHGFFGGYLIVNALARPMEFHCTLPVQPTRAQQILYGATLEEFVCGEQIARAMISKSKGKPRWIFTDGPATMSLRYLSETPVFWLESDESDSSELLPIPSVEINPDRYRTTQWRGCRLHSLRQHGDDLDPLILAGTEDEAIDFNLFEPFARIVEALREANPITKAA